MQFNKPVKQETSGGGLDYGNIIYHTFFTTSSSDARQISKLSFAFSGMDFIPLAPLKEGETNLILIPLNFTISYVTSARKNVTTSRMNITDYAEGFFKQGDKTMMQWYIEGKLYDEELSSDPVEQVGMEILFLVIVYTKSKNEPN